MTKRYFQVTNQSCKQAITDILAARTNAYDIANKWASDNGVGKAAMKTDGLFRLSLHGFSINDHYRNELADLGTWVKPKAGYVWPRSQKGKPLSTEFQELCKNVQVCDRELFDLLGFSPLSYMFSGGLGFECNDEKSEFFFVLDKAFSELENCKEVSNLEMIKLIKGDDNAK